MREIKCEHCAAKFDVSSFQYFVDWFINRPHDKYCPSMYCRGNR